MKLKTRDVVEAYSCLQVLAGRRIKLLPSFWIARQMRWLSVTVTEYEKQNTGLVKKHGEKSKDGKQWTVTSENREAYDAEITPLLDAEVDEHVEQHPLAYLQLEEIEPSLLVGLWFLIDEGETEAKSKKKKTAE